MRDRSRRTEALFAAPMTAHRERSFAADGTELVMRTTYEIGVLEIQGAGEVLEARAEGGEQFRFVESLPFSVLVADEAAAVVDVSRHDPAGGGSLLVRNPALVRGLSDLVEAVWRLGAPAGRARTRGAGPPRHGHPHAAGGRGLRRHDRAPVRHLPADGRAAGAGAHGPARRGHPVPGRRAGGPARMALSRAAAGPAGRVARVGRTSGSAPRAD